MLFELEGTHDHHQCDYGNLSSVVDSFWNTQVVWSSCLVLVVGTDSILPSSSMGNIYLVYGPDDVVGIQEWHVSTRR